ncbi:hypothetical protein ON010_g6539 [Phytophthora cinnamomi]|nr:hypothetical protein ON010_g6539 [Phytophthora cinnamomi]
MLAAVTNGHYDVIKGLITYGKLAPQSMIANQALKCAAQQGQQPGGAASGRRLAATTRCAERSGGSTGSTALGEVLKAAARAGREDVVQLVLADCHAHDVARALQDAAVAARWGVVRALHKHKGLGSRELGTTLTCAAVAANWDMVELLSPLCKEGRLKEAMRSAALQRRWDVVKLLCGKLQTQEYEQGLALADKDGGRALLDVLYKRCMCYEAEKAMAEALTHENWTAIKLLADMCYKESNNIDKAFNCAVSKGKWDVVKRLYKECSTEVVAQALMQAAKLDERIIVDILAEKCSIIDVQKARDQLSLNEKPVPVEIESKFKHGIRCIAPGDSPFVVDINALSTIHDLKTVIRDAKPEYFADVPSTSIWLYLTKRRDEWISANSEEIISIELGDCSSVRDLLVWQIMPSRHVKGVFQDSLQANVIHVIALKPILRCIVPGSRPFGINLDRIVRIEELEKAIQEEVGECFDTVDAGKTRLYLAKEYGEWMALSSNNAKALMLGERSSSMDTLFSNEISSMTQLGSPFADVFAIHVIVMNPNIALKPLRDVSSSKRLCLDSLHVRLLELQ